MLTRGQLIAMAATLSVYLTCTAGFAVADNAVAGKKPNTSDTVEAPQAVKAAFQKAYPKGEITRVSTETRDSSVYYEIESVEGKIQRSILYHPDGAVYEVEQVIPTGTLPKSVRSGISAKYPKLEITRAESMTRGTATEYEVRLETGKEKLEVVFDNSGKILRSEKLMDKEGESDEEDAD
jgi:hypothetical protein